MKKKTKKKVVKRKLAQKPVAPPKPAKNFLDRVKTFKLFQWVLDNKAMVAKESLEYVAERILKDLGFEVEVVQQLPRFLDSMDMEYQKKAPRKSVDVGTREILNAIHTLSLEIRELRDAVHGSTVYTRRRK